MPINRDFRDLFSKFNAADVRYLVVGAYAVIHHTEPRYTKGLDIWIEPTRDNARRALNALNAFGAPTKNLRVKDLCDPELVYQIGIEPNRIDILMGIKGVEFSLAWGRAEMARYGRTPIRLLALPDIIAAKRAAGRPQDLIDLANLQRVLQRVKKQS